MNEQLDMSFCSEFDNEFLEEYRRQVWFAENDEELINALPDSRYHGYIELMSYFKSYAAEEANDIYNMLNETQDEVDKLYLKNDLMLCNMRIKVFESLINEYNERLNKDSLLDANVDNFDGERQLIYLKSKAGNVLVESDLIDVTQENVVDMKSAFEFLKNGVFSSDQTKYKTLSNLKGLKGVREVKEYQSRIYFYHLENDIVIVFLALIKKANNPRKEREKILNRRGMLDAELKNIEFMLQDPIMREELLNEGREITERIDNLLSSKKLGGK